MEFEDFRPDGEGFVQIVDDGRVAHAYFFVDHKLTGSVWLYNRVPAVADIWDIPRGETPVNGIDYVSDQAFTPPSVEADFDFRWSLRDAVWEVDITIYGRLHAVLGDGDKLGRCVLAKIDGPLALRLDL